MNRCLVLFARIPKKNEVKTRLRPYLLNGSSEGIYRAFLNDMVQIANQVRCENKFIAFISSNNSKPAFLESIAPDFKIVKQVGNNLGERMYQVFKNILKCECHRVIIIGTDMPTLPPGNIHMAFEKLIHSDIVLGPSMDGGYYLVGLKKPHREIFLNIDWGTNQVFHQTMQRIKKAKLIVSFVPQCYDIDNGEGLHRLIDELKERKDDAIAYWTKKYLKI